MCLDRPASPCRRNRQRYVCALTADVIIIPSTNKSHLLGGMAEFCSSCSVLDSVRHHAKARSHFYFNHWMSASLCLIQPHRNEYSDAL